MLDLDRLFLGMALILIGSTLLLILLGTLGFRSRFNLMAIKDLKKPNASPRSAFHKDSPARRHNEPSDPTTDATHQTDACILIQPGGRILYSNRAAKEWLGESGKPLNLERLAKRAHPHQTFFEACAKEGRTSFTFDGRPVGAISSWVPVDRGGAMLVSMHRLQVLAGNYSSYGGSAIRAESAIVPTHFMDVFTHLNQEMTASLELEPTISTVLEIVENLIPAVFTEITIWDSEEQSLVPYSFSRLPGLERQLRKNDQRYHLGEGYSGYLIEKRESLSIPDVANCLDIRPAESRQPYPFRSYMGVPLLIGGEIVGTLELASIVREAFDQEDLEILKMLAGQAAVALHNAQVYRTEQRRTRELVGLAKLAQSVGGINEPHDLFRRLVDSMASLLDVEILGFLLYDENRRILSAQEPFHGFPGDFLSFYQVPIPPESQAEAILLSQEVIHTTNASEDPRLQALGLNHAAVASDIQHAAFIPLASGGRFLGYLQAANKTDGTPFNQEDLRLLSIIGGQAALSIENAALVQQTQQRAYRSEALRKIASLTSSIATLDEVLKWSLQELVRLVGADVGAIFLLNESNSELVLHNESLVGGSTDTLPAIQRLPVDGERLKSSACGNQQAFQSGKASQDAQISPLYLSLIEHLQVESIVDIPLIIRDRGIGEILIASQKTDQFDHNDFLTIATAAGQLAGAIERAALASQTDESLRRRVETMDELLSVSQALQADQPLKESLELIAASIQKITPFQIVLISVMNPQTGNLERITGVGLDANAMEALLTIQQPWSGIQKILQDDFRTGGVFFIPYEKLPVLPPEIHSYTPLPPEGPIPLKSAWHAEDVLIVPLLDPSGSPLGLISVDQPRDNLRPDRPTLESLELFASQASLVIETHSELGALQSVSEQYSGQMRALNSVANLVASQLRKDDLILSLLEQLASLIVFDTGTLWLKNDGRLEIKSVHGFADPEERIGLSVALEDSQLFREMIQNAQPINIGNILADQQFQMVLESERLSWLGIPLVVNSEVIGVIALEKNEADFFQPADIQLAMTFSQQAAMALKNATLHEEGLRQMAETEQRSKRLSQLNRFSTALIQTLDPHQIYLATLRELSQALSNPEAGITPAVEKPELNFSFLLWENPYQSNPDYSGDDDWIESTTPIDNRGTALLVAEYPPVDRPLPYSLPWIPLFDHIGLSQGVFISEDISLEQDLSPLDEFLKERNTQALLILPLITADKLHGLILVQGDRPYHFSAGEVELARTITNQAAISLANSRLFTQTRQLTAELEQRVEERTSQLTSEHERLTNLLRIITALSASLDLDQVLARTLVLLEGATSSDQVICLVWRPGEARLRYAASAGEFPSGFDLEDGWLTDATTGFASGLMFSRQAALISDLRVDERSISFVDKIGAHRSLLGLPLSVSEQLLGILLLTSAEPAHYSAEHLELVQAVAQQIAVAVNNTELYSLIRDQAEDLGNMLRNQQIETSRSRAILEAVAEGVLVTDAANRITLFNQSAEKILGLDRNLVIGRSLEDFIGIFGGAARDWMGTIHKWSGVPAQSASRETYSEQINLDTARVVSVNLAPVLSREEFLGTVSIFHDITEQIELDRLKSEFVATVSHELRTPMTSIKGYTEILLMGAAGTLSEQQVRFLEIVRNNTERLAVLVNDLLDISRIESGRVSLAMQPVDIQAILNEVVRDFEKRAMEENKKFDFKVKKVTDNLIVYADPQRVQEILQNLISNAYQYTDDGGSVNLHVERDGGMVQVDVRDTGIGIGSEEQTHIFERFYRGEHPLVLSKSGTGLGLSIVKHLVEMHGGQIWLQSDGIPGEGSLFSFTLPLYQAEMIDRPPVLIH